MTQPTSPGKTQLWPWDRILLVQHSSLPPGRLLQPLPPQRPQLAGVSIADTIAAHVWNHHLAIHVRSIFAHSTIVATNIGNRPGIDTQTLDSIGVWSPEEAFEFMSARKSVVRATAIWLPIDLRKRPSIVAELNGIDSATALMDDNLCNSLLACTISTDRYSTRTYTLLRTCGDSITRAANASLHCKSTQAIVCIDLHPKDSARADFFNAAGGLIEVRIKSSTVAMGMPNHIGRHWGIGLRARRETFQVQPVGRASVRASNLAAAPGWLATHPILGPVLAELLGQVQNLPNSMEGSQALTPSSNVGFQHLGAALLNGPSFFALALHHVSQPHITKAYVSIICRADATLHFGHVHDTFSWELQHFHAVLVHIHQPPGPSHHLDRLHLQTQSGRDKLKLVADGARPHEPPARFHNRGPPWTEGIHAFISTEDLKETLVTSLAGQEPHGLIEHCRGLLTHSLYPCCQPWHAIVCRSAECLSFTIANPVRQGPVQLINAFTQDLFQARSGLPKKATHNAQQAASRSHKGTCPRNQRSKRQQSVQGVKDEVCDLLRLLRASILNKVDGVLG